MCFLFGLGEKKLQVFLTDLNNYNPRIKFTFEFNKEHISFLDLKVSLCDGKLTTDLLVKPTDRHQYLYFTSAHPNIQNGLSYIVRHFSTFQCYYCFCWFLFAVTVVIITTHVIIIFILLNIY